MTRPGFEDWGDAFRAMSARIVAHPDFRRLVREVAIAEQPTGRPYRLRNSPTYAAWWTRGSRWPGRRGKYERARELARRIAEELDLYGGRLPASESTARVYGEARDYVRARALPPAR